MDNTSRMQMLDPAEHLIQQITHALMVQIHLDNLTQVGVHKFHDEINILELF